MIRYLLVLLVACATFLSGCILCPEGSTTEGGNNKLFCWGDSDEDLYSATCPAATCGTISATVNYADIHCLANVTEEPWPVGSLDGCSTTETTGTCTITYPCPPVAASATPNCVPDYQCNDALQIGGTPWFDLAGGYHTYGMNDVSGSCDYWVQSSVDAVNGAFYAYQAEINAALSQYCGGTSVIIDPPDFDTWNWQADATCVVDNAHKCNGSTVALARVSHKDMTGRMTLTVANSYIRLQKPGKTTTVPMHGSIAVKLSASGNKMLAGEVWGTSGSFDGDNFTAPKFVFDDPIVFTGTNTYTVSASAESAGNIIGKAGSQWGTSIGHIVPTSSGGGTINQTSHTFTFNQTMTSAGVLVTVHFEGSYL